MHLLHQCVLLSMHTKKPVSTSFYECNKITQNTSQYMLMRNSVYKQMNIDIGRRVCEMRPHPKCHDFKVHHPTESPNVYPMSHGSVDLLYPLLILSQKVAGPPVVSEMRPWDSAFSCSWPGRLCKRHQFPRIFPGRSGPGGCPQCFAQKQPKVRCGKVRFFFLALQLYQLYTSKKWGWQKLADFEFES